MSRVSFFFFNVFLRLFFDILVTLVLFESGGNLIIDDAWQFSY